MLIKLYECCYTQREIMIHDTKNKANFLKKIKFKIVSYFANKF